MLAGARELFAEGRGSVVVLGTDAPTLPLEYIREAAGSICGKDGYGVALTLSQDGGYVLVGLREAHVQLFEGVVWSTPEVRRQILAVVRRAGLSTYETPRWYALDESEDLNHLRAELAREPRLALRPARLLAARGA